MAPQMKFSFYNTGRRCDSWMVWRSASGRWDRGEISAITAISEIFRASGCDRSREEGMDSGCLRRSGLPST